VSPAALHRGDVFANDFMLGEAIGTGGMGAVYVAEQLSTGKLRALKIMHPQLVLDADLRARFEREARVGGAIDSEHVAEVVAAGVDEASGAPWIAMELLDGEDLDAHVARAGPMPVGSVIEVFRQVCHALGKAHELGIVHRDLKPENVFVARGRSAESPITIKLLDFGVAKLMAETRTGTATLGTPLWMSPEQSDPQASLTPAADTWALGLLAFWLLTGKYYWATANRPGASLQAILREILFEPLVPPSARAAELGAGGLPDGFDAWFERCLQRHPPERFQTSRDLFDGLSALGGSEPAPLLSLPPKVARATSLAPRAARLTPRADPLAATTGASPKRGTLRPLVLGLAGALTTSVAAFAIFSGYVRFGAPPAPSLEPSSAEASPTETAMATARPSEAPRVADLPTASPPDPSAVDALSSSGPWASSAPVASSGPVAASASQRVVATGKVRRFDAQTANRALERAAKLASTSCGKKQGPRAIALRVVFNRSGRPIRVSHKHVPDALTETGLCAQGVIYSAMMDPFDEPPEAVVAFVVGID
jgi:serine/threonine protein kinase